MPTAKTSPAEPAVRRVPSQRRSRERQERILQTARSLIEQHGSEALRMSEVAQQAGIGIGSLYQYFPDRAALIATLTESYNAVGRACTARELAGVQRRADLVPALARITDGFYAMYLAFPVMRDLWAATQADKTLWALEETDAEAHTTMLEATLATLYPATDPAQRHTAAVLIMQLMASTVRLAIVVERAQGEALVETFNRTVLGGLLGTLDGPPQG